jgi:hypothetical protein
MRAVIEYLVELDGHSDYLPTLLRIVDIAVAGAGRLSGSHRGEQEGGFFGLPLCISAIIADPNEGTSSRTPR